MALQTHLAVGFVPEISCLEVTRVWTNLAATVALYTHIS